jgi:hypothetical protein
MVNEYEAARAYMEKEAMPAAVLNGVRKLWGARALLPAFLRTGRAGIGLRQGVSNLLHGYGSLAQNAGNFGLRHFGRNQKARDLFLKTRGVGYRLLNEGLRQNLRSKALSKGFFSPVRWDEKDDLLGMLKNVGTAVNPYNWAKGLSRNWLGAGLMMSPAAPLYYGPAMLANPVKNAPWLAMDAYRYAPGKSNRPFRNKPVDRA